MPIQIPFHSQAAPGVVPNAGARAMPGGFGSLQQAAKMPLNDQRATADMFSGGLQGLQSVGNLLGNVGSGLFGIAQDLRKQDDFVIEAKSDESYAGKVDSYNAFRQQNPHSPEMWGPEAERLMSDYSEEVLSQDMPSYLKDKLTHKYAMNSASLKSQVFLDRDDYIRKEAGAHYLAGVEGMAKSGLTDLIPGYVDNAVERNILSYEAGEQHKKMYQQQALETNVWMHINQNPREALKELKADNYPGLEPQQEKRLESAARSGANAEQADLYNAIRQNPGNYTEDSMKLMLEQEDIEPSFYQKWVDAQDQGELTDEEYAAYSDAILSYDQDKDTSNATRRNMESMLALVKARGDDASYKALDDLFTKQTGKTTSPVLSMGNKLVDAIVDASVTDERAAVVRKAELKMAVRDFYDNSAVKPGIKEMKKFVDEQFEKPDTSSRPSLPTPAGIAPRLGVPGQGSTQQSAPAFGVPDQIPAPLAPHATTFQKAGDNNGIDPRFLMAISMFETGGGKSSAFRNKKNAMGVSNSKGPIKFNSRDDSIYSMARKLASSTGPYRNANTIAEIGAIYSPPGASNDPNGTNHSWPSQVAAFYRKLGGDPSKPVKGI